MAQVEWNKKEELVSEQAIKHLKKFACVMAAVARSPEAELKLMVKIQEYCYENMVFMKVFQKIVVLFYKSKTAFSHLQNTLILTSFLPLLLYIFTPKNVFV